LFRDPIPPCVYHCASQRILIFFSFLITSWNSSKEVDGEVQWAQGNTLRVHVTAIPHVWTSVALLFNSCWPFTGDRKAWCLYGEAKEEECLQRSSLHAIPKGRGRCITMSLIVIPAFFYYSVVLMSRIFISNHDTIIYSWALVAGSNRLL
jgi:hypothetical protein